MAKTIQALQARELEALPPGRHSDGGGLYFLVKASGSRSWTARISDGGAVRDRGLGGYPAVSLKDARKKFLDLQRAADEGTAPPSKQKAKTLTPAAPNPAGLPTFKVLAEACIVEWRPRTKAARLGRKCASLARWRNSLSYCTPIFDTPVDAVTTPQVEAILLPIWHAKPEIAKNVQGLIQKVLDVARVRHSLKVENPARLRGHLSVTLGKRPKLTKGRHKSLPYEDAPAFLADMRQRAGLGAAALELAILTGLRTGEVIEATWGEFDLERRLWKIPAVRVKNGDTLRENGIDHHKVPLSDTAVGVLQRQKAARLSDKPSAWVFPGGAAGKPISTNTMRAVLLRMDLDITVHGFRSTVRDWAGDREIELVDGRRLQAYSWEACEITLGHVVGNEASRAYRRGDALEERRRLLSDWADFLDGKVKVERDPASDLLAFVRAKGLLAEFEGQARAA